MNITERSQGNWKVLLLSGRIDNPGAVIFKDRLIPLASVRHCRIVLDFAGVVYLSSAGLRVLLIAAQQAKAGTGKLHVCHVTPTIRDFFKMSGLDKVLPIYSTISEAAPREG